MSYIRTFDYYSKGVSQINSTVPPRGLWQSVHKYLAYSACRHASGPTHFPYGMNVCSMDPSLQEIHNRT